MIPGVIWNEIRLFVKPILNLNSNTFLCVISVTTVTETVTHKEDVSRFRINKTH